MRATAVNGMLAIDGYRVGWAGGLAGHYAVGRRERLDARSMLAERTRPSSVRSAACQQAVIAPP